MAQPPAYNRTVLTGIFYLEVLLMINAVHSVDWAIVPRLRNAHGEVKIEAVNLIN